MAVIFLRELLPLALLGRSSHADLAVPTGRLPCLSPLMLLSDPRANCRSGNCVSCASSSRETQKTAGALSCAFELDGLGRGRSAAFNFFVRTTREVCDAVLPSGHQRSDSILRRHALRIDDPQSRRAFRSAAGLPEIGKARKREVPKPSSFIGSGAVPEPFRFKDQRAET
jgi:hypothetical protein